MKKVKIFTWQPDFVEARTTQTEKKLSMYRVKSLRYMCEFIAENSPEMRLNIRYKAQAYWAIKQQIQVHYYGGLPENCATISSSSSLDLHALEKRLDEALSKETDESLNKWLKNKRQ